MLESEVFRFLIAAIMGLAILMIVIAIIQNTNELKKEANISDFYSKIDSAVEGAGLDKYIIANSVIFDKGQTLNSEQIKHRYTNISKIYFHTSGNLFEDLVDKVVAKRDCKVNIYIKCNNDSHEDTISCDFHLGTKPDDYD